MKKTLGIVAAVILTVHLISGCDLFFRPDIETGNLEITVQKPATLLSVTPPQMNIALTSYTFSGIGPGDALITETTQNSGNFSVNALVPGAWTISVDGRNQFGDLIASGNTTVTVITGTTVPGTIQLVPESGDGTLNLTVGWPEDFFIDAIVGVITFGAETVSEFSLTPDANSATYSANLPAGSYQLVVSLRLNEQDIAPPRMTAVIIYASMVSNGTMDFSTSEVTGMVRAPEFSIPGAVYTTTQYVELNSPTERASIRYTIDGTDPSREYGTLYSAPIEVSESMELRAIAFLDGWVDSEVSSSEYFIYGDLSLVVLDPPYIELELSAVQYEIVEGSVVTLTATPSAQVDLYSWYVDGVLVDEGALVSEYVFGAGRWIGPHTVTVVVERGGRIFSASTYITILAP